MEKVKRFFRELHENRKYQVVFFVVSMCVIFGLFLGVRIKLATVKALEFTIVEDKNLIKYVEEVKVENNKLVVTGWCFYKNADSKKNKVQIILRNLENNNDIVALDTKEVAREDVATYYCGSTDYSQTGFQASTRVNNINLDTYDYEILIKLTYFEEVKRIHSEEIVDIEYTKTIATNRYVCNGELTIAKPDVHIKKIETISKTLNTIISEGQLLSYREDADIYIYQYKEKIYWIAGEEYCFEEDGTTRMEYHLDTTELSKLPENRLADGHYWDNIGFYFELNEIVDEEFFPYRVASRDIPKEYPVSCFWTGYHTNNEWVWKEYLNLDIREIVR